MQEWFEELRRQFILNFIDGDRWRYLWDGLGVTLKVTVFALLIGVVIGVILSIIRSTYDKNVHMYGGSVGRFILSCLNRISEIYINIVRGTPVVLQLLIFYFIVFVSSRDGVLIGTITFGINSGAYVAEIFRGGIMSIDNGQFEAGRSLGFGYVRTMRYIIIPQAFKNVLPSLLNEFIVLLKETAILGYVAIQDLTKGANIIIGRTFDAFMPLIAAAIIYLIIVLILTKLVGKLERRLRSSEH